jgi:hypothetical protein
MRPKPKRATIAWMSSTIAYPDLEWPSEAILPSDEEADDVDGPKRATCLLEWTEPETEGIFPGYPLS